MKPLCNITNPDGTPCPKLANGRMKQCSMHYARIARHGDPYITKRLLGATLEERIWQHVRKTDDCWVWEGVCNSDGYGQITVAKKRQYVHRLVFTIVNGEIPKGMKVCHRCDNPPCCRPDHLFMGTQKENQMDMKQKGRARNRFSV